MLYSHTGEQRKYLIRFFLLLFINVQAQAGGRKSDLALLPNHNRDKLGQKAWLYCFGELRKY